MSSHPADPRTPHPWHEGDRPDPVVPPAPAPGRGFQDKLADARAKVDGGHVRTAREELEALYREALVSGRTGNVRLVIDLLYSLNRQLDSGRVERLRAAAEARLARGDVRSALQLLGGHSDPRVNVEPDLVLVRLLTHVTLGRYEDAERDLEILRPHMQRGEVAVPNYDDLAERLAIERMKRAGGPAVTHAFEAVEAGRGDAALRELEAVPSARASQPMVLVLRARALELCGAGAEVRVAADEAAVAAADADELTRIAVARSLARLTSGHRGSEAAGDTLVETTEQPVQEGGEDGPCRRAIDVVLSRLRTEDPLPAAILGGVRAALARELARGAGDLGGIADRCDQGFDAEQWLETALRIDE